MPIQRELIINQPALIPIAGNFDRKPRSLDREVTTVGRARGCDLCLEANEISTLHCVIFRTADGFRIRDCNSRCGTRVNGESLKLARLFDGDIVNLGPFSFEFHVPTALFPKENGRPDPAMIEHWRKSRERLVKRALKLRRKLRSRPLASPDEQDYHQKAHVLKEKIRCYDQRFGDLEAAEKELSEERDQLAADMEKHRQRVQAIEKSLADRLAETEREIHEKWQQFQQRCQTEQAKPHTCDTVHDEAGRRLQELRDQSQRLNQLEEQFDRRLQQWQREQREFNTMKEQWAQDQAKTSASMEQQMSALTQQKAELVRMMGDLKKMQEDLRKQAKPDVRALQEEIDCLKAENAKLRDAASSHSPIPDDFGKHLEDLRAEIELLHEELENKDRTLQALQQPAVAPGDEDLRAENEMLKKLLEELQPEEKGPAKTESDLERYETELNEFRRQLEEDRTKLNKEVETLRERNQEMDETIRDMEMELSKERAELARERMRLDRVREEVKADMERLQREQNVRDSLAPVQKLREEITGKPAAAKNDKPLNDRLRGIRNQLSDSPTASS